MELDAYVVDTLMPDLVGHDRHPSAFLVYLYLWRRTQSADVEEVEISLRDLAERTGLSRRAVQDALARLTSRRLVTIERETSTSVSVYRVHRTWKSRRSAPGTAAVFSARP